MRYLAVVVIVAVLMNDFGFLDAKGIIMVSRRRWPCPASKMYLNTVLLRSAMGESLNHLALPDIIAALGVVIDAKSYYRSAWNSRADR